MARVQLVAAALVSAALAAGCGGGGPKKLETVPVTGKLVYKSPGKDSVPAAGALVVFNPNPQDEKNLYYPQATVRPDGSFTLTTYAEGDGAPVGEYGVTVLWRAANVKTIGGEDRGTGEDRLGRRYADPKSPRLKFKVEKGGNAPSFTVE